MLVGKFRLKPKPQTKTTRRGPAASGGATKEAVLKKFGLE
jgi:hypothetical protein